MHIGINAQLLSSSQNYRNGGISRYIRYLVNGLAQQPGAHTYTIFVNGQQLADQLVHHPQVRYIAAPWPEEKPVARVLWEQFTLPSLVRQEQIDVLHSPANVRPERLPANCASVITLHDLAFMRYPQVLTKSKRLYHRTFTLRSIQRTTLLITDSDSTKQDAHQLARVPLERMQTVYPCIDTRFSGEHDADLLHKLREQHGLTDGFILYLGTLEPRKNLSTLIDAYIILRERYNVREKLVLAGSKGWLYEALFEKVRQSGLENAILFPGFVDDHAQAHWYQAASVFAYPSLYEGFGLPVAEALACGTPVVTSNVSSLPEAGGDLAYCVDPHDPQALADALYQALTDQAGRMRCRTLAGTIAKKFSVQAMVRQMINAYERAAELQQSRRSEHV